MIFGFFRKENIFLLQHYHPIRHIHCQIAVSEFPTDLDSWDMLTIIGSRSLETEVCINGPGHMTKMAAMPIYGKNL